MNSNPAVSIARPGYATMVRQVMRQIVDMMKQMMFIFLLLLGATGIARAEDKCESTEHGVSHAINGKNYVCDKCVVLGCDTSGGKIGQCTRTTKYTNCVEAAKPDTKK